MLSNVYFGSSGLKDGIFGGKIGQAKRVIPPEAFLNWNGVYATPKLLT